jgi:transcriptional regulator with XRE-family HTH domain/NTP pyrophosphatase (non-canonical NTP hydrolase)
MTDEELGNRVKKRRGTSGLRDTAKEIGVSHATLSRVERGYPPNLENYQKICGWLKEKNMTDEHLIAAAMGATRQTAMAGVQDALAAYRKTAADSIERRRARAEKAEAELSAIATVMNRTGAEFLDPPDGGNVPLGEQISRLIDAREKAKRERDQLRISVNYAIRKLEENGFYFQAGKAFDLAEGDEATARSATTEPDEALVERVARAIHAQCGGVHTEEGREFEPFAWEELDDPEYPAVREQYRGQARAAIRAMRDGEDGSSTYQSRVVKWIRECFPANVVSDTKERSFRFVEEALELVQANGATEREVLAMVNYVYSRQAGELRQEVGGVLVCLAALCHAAGIDMAQAGEDELFRVWSNIEKIRAKHASKPADVRSSLPGDAQ